MLFNSIDFLLFIVPVFFLYWFIFNKSIKIQNGFLIAASYFFYGYWDWRFLSLILFSSIVDFLIGIYLGKTRNKKHRQYLLYISLISNLGILGAFKYFDFFIGSLLELLHGADIYFNEITLQLTLPVGISFYTFQTLSYTIDVYRGKIEPTKDVLAFFAFVSFFPQLVAGPIERASALLCQFKKERLFTHKSAVIGLRLMLWGFFKKMVIADNCALIVNDIFSNYQHMSGAVLILGAVLFSFQIYGDFSGYSDIARGLAQLFGFKLMVNFKTPYFSRDIAEFWRRWHISLSTWFRDYLYIPLGGSKGGRTNAIRNIMIIFLVSGLWHGANWTFVAWGFLNALFFIPLFIFNSNRSNLDIVAEGKIIPSVVDVMKMSLTFFMVSLAWVFFRSDTIMDAFGYLNNIIFNFSFLGLWNYLTRPIISLVLLFVIMEWTMRESDYMFEKQDLLRPIKWSSYIALGCSILLFSPKEFQEFIYFQF